MADETKLEPLKEGLPNSVFTRAAEQTRRRSDQYQQIYANNMSVGLNTWDVAITFGEIVGEEDGKTVVEETTKIVMTREIAKVLVTLLGNHLAIFEDKFWEIKIPALENVAGEQNAESKVEEIPNSLTKG